MIDSRASMLETKWVNQSVQYVIWELVFGVAIYLGITSPCRQIIPILDSQLM